MSDDETRRARSKRVIAGSTQNIEFDRILNASSHRVKVTSDSVPEQSLKKKSGHLDDLRMRDHELDHNLKKILGYGAVGILTLQVILTNAACITYGWITVRNGGSLSDAAIVAWMSSTIVEIVALALVVTKYLFPESGNNWNHEPRKIDDDK